MGSGRAASVRLADDPRDPDPAWQRAVAEQSAQPIGLRLLCVFLLMPRGHVGVDESVFDAVLGSSIASFVDPRGVDSAPP